VERFGIFNLEGKELLKQGLGCGDFAGVAEPHGVLDGFVNRHGLCIFAKWMVFSGKMGELHIR